jgi:hypothetical protein
VELSSLTTTLDSVAAASARVEAISSQATGQAGSFASMLSEARAAIDGDAPAAELATGRTAQAVDDRRAGLAALMGSTVGAAATGSGRSLTLGQALSLWGAAASSSGPGQADGASPSLPCGLSAAPLLPGDGSWTEGLPASGRAIAGSIDAAARAEGVDPRLLASLVWAESSFHQGSVSHAGAQGLTQLMPATASGLGLDASDPVQNLRGGARYLKVQLDRFGSPELALAAYNAGPGRVRQAGGIPDIPETQGYVRTVMGHYRTLGGQA